MLAGNALTGQLPGQWGNRNQFSSLTLLDLSGELAHGQCMCVFSAAILQWPSRLSRATDFACALRDPALPTRISQHLAHLPAQSI